MFAWETTVDDVLNVLSERFRIGASFEDAGRILNALDVFRIEKVAIRGDSMEMQTQAAYDEIARQLEELRFVGPGSKEWRPGGRRG